MGKAGFLFDGGSVLLEKQGSATTATYTYGNALIRKDGETPLFEGLGSERTVTNSSGAVQGTLTSSAFGQTVASTGGSTSAYGFGATSGYRSKGDAGLTLVGCRFYDAQVGRFITRDTDLDQKPYAYCDGDPVNATDPSGHEGVSPDAHYGAGGADKDLGISIIVGTLLALPVLIPIGPVGWAIAITTAGIGGYLAIQGAFEQDAAEHPAPPEHPAPKADGCVYPAPGPHFSD